MTSTDKMRRGIIEKFQKGDGFDVLILSPEVVGMGLTLTEPIMSSIMEDGGVRRKKLKRTTASIESVRRKMLISIT